MKNKFIKLFTMLLILGLVTGCGCSNKESKEKNNNLVEDIKANTNENVIKDQVLDVFTFTNISLIYENGTSTLETLVTNTSSEPQYLTEFKVHVKNELGEEIVTLTGFVGASIEANGTETIISSYGDDLSNAYSIEYEIVR